MLLFNHRLFSGGFVAGELVQSSPDLYRELSRASQWCVQIRAANLTLDSKVNWFMQASADGSSWQTLAGKSTATLPKEEVSYVIDSTETQGPGPFTRFSLQLESGTGNLQFWVCGRARTRDRSMVSMAGLPGGMTAAKSSGRSGLIQPSRGLVTPRRVAAAAPMAGGTTRIAGANMASAGLAPRNSVKAPSVSTAGLSPIIQPSRGLATPTRYSGGTSMGGKDGRTGGANLASAGLAGSAKGSETGRGRGARGSTDPDPNLADAAARPARAGNLACAPASSACATDCGCMARNPLRLPDMGERNARGNWGGYRAVEMPFGLDTSCHLTDLQGGPKPTRHGSAWDPSMTYFTPDEFLGLQEVVERNNRAYPRLPLTGFDPETGAPWNLDTSGCLGRIDPGPCIEDWKLGKLGAWAAPRSRVSTHVEFLPGFGSALFLDWEEDLRSQFPPRLVELHDRMQRAGAIATVFGDWRFNLARWVTENTKEDVCVGPGIYHLDPTLPHWLGFVGGYYTVPRGFGGGTAPAIDLPVSRVPRPRYCRYRKCQDLTAAECALCVRHWGGDGNDVADCCGSYR